jgi:hypothetical protein
MCPASIFDRSRMSLMSARQSSPDAQMSFRYSSCLGVSGPTQPRAQYFRESDDGVERRAQLVGHVGEELALVLVRLLQQPRLLAQLGGAVFHLLLEDREGPREPCAEDRGDGQAKHQQPQRAQDRIVERRVHLGDRLLDEHGPAERLDGRVRGEHAAAFRSIASPSGGAAGSLARAHVVEPREVGLAQHEAT